MSNAFENIIREFIKVNNEFTYVQKKEIKLSEEILLTTSAIHLLKTIERYPKKNTNELAKILGVTKGNISQQSKKWIVKGLIKKMQT